MSSILNSISSGDLEVQKAPQVKPVKEDSIIDILQNSEIEFETCPKLEDNLDDFNTGFGENNDLHYETNCKTHELKKPLYQENFLREFVTEEEKAAARHSLGLYNKGDVVAMSMLTSEEAIPSQQDWNEAALAQMKKGDKFFTPYTSFNAVFNKSGQTLTTVVSNLNTLITAQQKEIAQMNATSNGDSISSLGDVRVFLQGIRNGNSLKNILDDMNQEMLRFEKTGQITT